MTELDLIKLWNDKRKQLISAQLHSVITIAVIAVLAAMGYLGSASSEAQFFALLFLATIGALGILNQFAVIREAKALVEDLAKHTDLSAISVSIVGAKQFLVFTQVMMTGFSVALLVGFGLIIA